MNINLLPTAVLEWLKNQGSALLQPGKEAPQPSFESGKTYQAQVLASLSSGRYIVKVEDQVLDMSLPKVTRQGETLNLTFLKDQPRATFLLTPAAQEKLAQGQSAGQQAAVKVNESVVKIAELATWASRLAAQTATQRAALADPTAELAGQAKSATLPGAGANQAANALLANAVKAAALQSPTDSTQAQLTAEEAQAGQGAKTPTNQQATPTQPPAQTTGQAVAGQQPALAKPGAAAALATPAGNSTAATQPNPSNPAVSNPATAGVAANAARTAAEAILAKPGANVPLPPPSAALASNPLLTTHSTQAMVDQAADQPQAWLAPLRQAVKESGMFYEANLQRWASGQQGLAEVQKQPQASLTREAAAAQGAQVRELGGMHEDVARLAGRQLQMLEGQPFVWQGLAWPGQTMQWQVEERQGGNGRGEQEEAPWRTQLRLTLPRLGGVFAEIDLAPQGIKLKLAADSADALGELRDALPQLTGRMDAAGLSVLGVALDAAEPGAS